LLADYLYHQPANSPMKNLMRQGALIDHCNNLFNAGSIRINPGRLFHS
jgi:hypothetical protein